MTKPALFVSVISTDCSLSQLEFQHVTYVNPESFVRGVPTLTFFVVFLVDEGREDPNTTLSGTLLARQ